MPLKQQVVDQLSGEWQVGLCEAPCSAPLSFCYGCLCSCCMAAQQRQQILDVIGEPYVCCGGMFPCCGLDSPQDSSCAWVEACCCPGLAVAANRFLIQTRFDRQNTACDDCILWVTCLAPWVVCLCQCAGVDVPDEVENCVDCLQMSVTGCMLAQQKVEIDYVKTTGFSGPPPCVVGMLPPAQQQMISHAKPMGPVAAAGVAAGAMVGGAAGAAVMYGAHGGQSAVTPQPMVMGHMAPGAEPYAPAQTVMAVQPMGGFMSTVAPNGMPWWQYCQGRPVSIDPASGFLIGPWGECLAWAKVFEIQSPGWQQDPKYASDGPCGQVIAAALASCPGHLKGPTGQAAERLELACEEAAFNAAPLPVIGQMGGEDPLPQSKMLWKSMPPKMSVIAFFKSCCHVQGETSLYVVAVLPVELADAFDSLFLILLALQASDACGLIRVFGVVTRSGLSRYNPANTASWVLCQQAFCDGFLTLPPPQEPEGMPPRTTVEDAVESDAAEEVGHRLFQVFLPCTG
eukprot:CAMPEP_0115201832 /NCGR_PEP_ID=MMETSP0270-20121206/17824_1 /TAXON_ID=71861 /ORGANISM="Scrippsiella trochoidea, Strain CCMP3099" /LENGTH=512 /DNA_ID=CAMNT_0002615247 /DNA_START=28 /DNA_END=1568 /DNA_ORIENTATION=-